MGIVISITDMILFMTLISMVEPPENSATTVLLPLSVTTTCLERGEGGGGGEGEEEGKRESEKVIFKWRWDIKATPIMLEDLWDPGGRE